jgi:hypothetical protein
VHSRSFAQPLAGPRIQKFEIGHPGYCIERIMKQVGFELLDPGHSLQWRKTPGQPTIEGELAHLSGWQPVEVETRVPREGQSIK